LVKVKICGITNLEDSLASFLLGADALGFVFYKKSARYISPQKCANISAILPKKILRVGVFVDEKAGRVKKIAKACRLDMLQFHGNESPAYCGKFKGYKVIKAFRVGKKIDSDEILRYKTYAYLFDTYSKSKAGGTGEKFNWKLLAKTAKINLCMPRTKVGVMSKVDTEPLASGACIKRIVFVSGGLTGSNVQKAVKLLKPDWVDASSSLEIRPGKKDHRKIKRFIDKGKQGLSPREAVCEG
jgi:phosphoribosylanthranilate isomerase